MAKSVKKEKPNPTTISGASEVPYEPSDFVIKEVMHQKNCSREEAIRILKNPTPHN